MSPPELGTDCHPLSQASHPPNISIAVQPTASVSQLPQPPLLTQQRIFTPQQQPQLPQQQQPFRQPQPRLGAPQQPSQATTSTARQSTISFSKKS